MTPTLAGKRALVTGASTGIGRATALALAQAGADVIVHYAHAASRADAEATVARARELGRDARAAQADFTQRASIAALAEAAGPVDVLVNNAATIEAAIDVATEDGGFDKHMARWDEVMDVNLRAPYELTWRVADKMLSRGSEGCIVNVASVSGMYALTDAPLYSLSKAALLHFTRQAALRYAPTVRVNAVAPGWVETGFNQGLARDPEFQRQIRAEVPLGRLASAEEVARAVLYLVRDAPYATGTTLTLDGGLVTELR